MASDTQQMSAQRHRNRQYALTQQILMSGKLWCGHAEGFESGLRAWELDVGDWNALLELHSPETLERIRPLQQQMDREMMTGYTTLSGKATGNNDQHELHKDCWRPGGGAYDNSTDDNNNTQESKSHKKGRGKSRHVDVVVTNEPSDAVSHHRMVHKHRIILENYPAIQTWNRGSWV